MKKQTKRLSLILAILICITAFTALFTACAEQGSDDDGEIYNGVGEYDGTRATYPDNLPDDLDYDGATINIYHRGGDWIEKYECAGEAGSDIVYNAVYERNAKVAARLNIKFQWYASDGGLESTKNEIVTYLASWNDDYDIILTTNNTIVSAGMNSYFWDFNSAMYIDLAQPYWWTDCIKEIAFDGKTYNFLVGDMLLNNFMKMSAFYFNCELIQKYLNMTASDMYAMVDDGTWTLDMLNLLANKCYEDKNGNKIADEGDLFGLPIASSGETLCQILLSTDIEFYTRKPNGLIELKMKNNSDIITLCEKVSALTYNNNGTYIQAQKNGNSGFDGFIIDDFAEGKYVFMAQRFTAACTTSMREMEADYGIIPYPTLNEGDEYVSYIQSSSSSVSCPYSISEERFDRACAVLEALNAEAYRSVTYTFYEMALKSKYVRDDYDSPRMIDIIYNTATKYFLDEYGGKAGSILNTMYSSVINKTSVSTALESKQDAAENSINKFIAECKAAYQ